MNRRINFLHSLPQNTAWAINRVDDSGGSPILSRGVYRTVTVTGDVSRGGENRKMGGQAKEATDSVAVRLKECQNQTAVHGAAGGCFHLGAQLVFSRDLRRGSQWRDLWA